MMHMLAEAGAAGWTLEGLFTWDNAIALVTLTALEIVLGIDNIVFIAILVGRLPEHQRARARTLGLSLALITRIALLATITVIIGLAKTPLIPVPFMQETLHNADGTTTTQAMNISGRDLILILGGLFLLGKATLEIHHKIEGHEESHAASAARAAFGKIIFQILLIDIVFSLDSVITAVGMARALPVMVAAVMISVGVMLVFAGRISRFIEKHPTMKMLALAFLLMIGIVLVADGLGQHISKGYIYFAMAFSLGVEVLNLLSRGKAAKAAAAAPD
ncbi:MAG: TerC family protein [Planctomycetota bacterium]|nr:TerC family protein [Planctomycetota bacterium]